MFIEIQHEYLSPDNMRLPFVLCDFGKNSEQEEVIRPNGFPHQHLLWVEKGSGQFTVCGEGFVLSEGQGFFCRRGIPHSYRPLESGFGTAWITFLCTEEILSYYSVPDRLCFDSASDLLREAYEELEALCSGNSNALSRSATGYVWICRWLTQIHEPFATVEATVIQFLESHYSEPLTLEEVAESVHMDKYSLCRYFKKSCGISVMEQLKKIRIAKAKRLLRYNQQSRIERIGSMCGYDNPSYFGKLFREQTGQSPKEYQTKHKA